MPAIDKPQAIFENLNLFYPSIFLQIFKRKTVMQT